MTQDIVKPADEARLCIKERAVALAWHVEFVKCSPPPMTNDDTGYS